MVQVLTLTNPFIIKYFTEYILDGKNALAGIFDFWDFSMTLHF